MASSEPTSRTTVYGEDTAAPTKPAPLVPDHKKYFYKPAPMNVSTQEIVRSAHVEKIKIDVPATLYATGKLVHALCSAARANIWSPECEKALVDNLPLREHHMALLSHNMIVTMIGAMVARALEQATRDCKDTLDLLADRYYVRRILCHDSSKTSTIEAAAYAGIMAIHMDKEIVVANAKRGQRLSKRCGSSHTKKDGKASSLDKLYTDTDSLLTPMANFGFKHHYEKNPHHPEHFPRREIDDMSLVEAIVDGLACVFERNKNHTDVHSWLNMYYVSRFVGQGKTLAQSIIQALKLYITNADYKALEAFRVSIFSIIGESIPSCRVTTTECCSAETGQDDGGVLHDFRSRFSV